MLAQMQLRFLRGKEALETAEYAILGAAIIVIVYAIYRALGTQIVNVINQVIAGMG